MKEIVINGGTALSGCVKVSGSKNAVLPIIFATLVTRGVSRLDNVPDIGDVRVALRIISELGARVIRLGSTLYIDTENLEYKEVSSTLLSRIRASSYLMGASLARFGRCKVTHPGGCNFSDRPIDLHIYAAECLGAYYDGTYLSVPRLVGGEIRLRTASVGATANALIMASSIDSVSEIYNFAKEPHVMALARFLASAGASIFIDDDKITVRGRSLSGGYARVIGDMIEAGTYLAAGIITGGEVSVCGVDVADMRSFLSFLGAIGVNVRIEGDKITASRADIHRAVNVVAEPYPAFATDLVPVAVPIIAALSRGTVYDNVWRERFGYLGELSCFGLRSSRTDGGALIHHSLLKSASVSAPDLRGGAACVLCALAAEGQSVVSNAEIILRGYEKIDKKLRALGADIIIRNKEKRKTK